MIDIIENASAPYYGSSYTGHWTNYANNRIWWAFTKDALPISQVDPDYLWQGRHNHETGWSGVIHAKATGTCCRVDDAAYHSLSVFTEENWAKSSTLGRQLFVTGPCINVKHPSSYYAQYDHCILVYEPEQLCTFIQVSNWKATGYADVVVGALYLHPYTDDSGQTRFYPVIAVSGCNSVHNNMKPWKPSTSRGTTLNLESFPHAPSIGWVRNLTGDLRVDSLHILSLCVEAVRRHRCPDSELSKHVGNMRYQRYDIHPKSSHDYLYDHQIIRAARGELFKLADAMHIAQSQYRGELQATSFDSINRFDGNMLALIADIKSIGSSSVSILTNLMKSAKNPRLLARAWLSARYGDRLTYNDLKSLFKGFNRNPWRRTWFSRFLLGSSRRSVSIDSAFGQITVQLNTKIAVTPRDWNAAMRAIRHAYEWDYYPSLANIWDMIPLSFVVDWFVDVSNIFEDLDRLVQARYYDVTCVLESAKSTTGSTTLKGVLLSYYDRSTSPALSLGMSSVELGLPDVINIVDAGTLLLG